MSSTISAGTTAGTAIAISGDTSGQLVLQTNGTTTAVTISTGQVVTLAQPLPVASGGSGVITSTGTGANVLSISPSLTTPALGTPASGVLTNCTGVVATTLATRQVTTSGTAFDFTGIPSGTKEILVMFVGTAISTTSNYLLRIGDATSMKTTGYLSESGRNEGTSVNSTAGFILTSNIGASQISSGIITLTLQNSSTWTWAQAGVLNATAGPCHTSGGSISLVSELTQLRITSVAGDAFNAGSINIQYRS